MTDSILYCILYGETIKFEHESDAYIAYVDTWPMKATDFAAVQGINVDKNYYFSPA